ncbi:uncharacterized protein LOC119393447 isoform X2 [Rhipicephalus sanguineus]|uniref:uncharacterized protein LOC119393447 isoform X2 n=1 Tax=Rhipicephalus sanguineus TaxID=34632 RepID=UPI0018952C38|nr:uncharacterized protein LOC119393447 isoform X2 [Rhipicephalus sanguineus]
MHRGQPKQQNRRVCPATLLAYFGIGVVVVSGSAAVKETGEGICTSVGNFCNTSKCLPNANATSFTCKCDTGQQQYFNATARRCYHLHSCLHNQCLHSTCEDGDGYREAKCILEDGADPQAIRKRICVDSGGRVKEPDGEAEFECVCPQRSQLLSGSSCLPDRNCTPEEISKCAERGRQCVLLGAEAQCKCPDDSIELADRCSDKCTIEKQTECRTPLSSCIVRAGKETCRCLPPLQWNSTSRRCIPANEFKYTIQFKVHPEEPEQEGTLAHCNDTAWLANAHEAMKNLYGKLLTKTAVHECGEIATVKLTFLEEPNRYVLRRIHLCEIRASSSGCFFPPSLRIVKGSVSGPDPVDVCTEYFRDVHKNTNGSYYCTVEENGRYTLRCNGGDVADKIAKVVLEVQHCRGTKHPDKSSASIWYAAIGIVSVAFFAIALLLLCTFKQRIYFYYRVSSDEVPSDTVKYRA